MPFAVSERDGVLRLTLDTPGSAVNIFNLATARQLIDVLAQVSPASTRAIVFDSAKPNSFLNGVGLLLAHASQTLDDLHRASELPWAAYRAVHEAPVPTIALIQGTCFGCGVELALNCDHRVATDSGETQFYMTELNDYLFLPLFGSTWTLPATVGLEAAVDLLLWGERWDAARAAAGGLVDAVVPFAGGDAAACFAGGDAAARFVDRVCAGEVEARPRPPCWGATEDAAVARARHRIAALPAAYRPVYGEGLELLIDGARQRGTYLEHQRRELDRSAASALAPIGKAAYAFFYLRQMAAERAAGRQRATDEPAALWLDVEPRGAASAFGDRLRARLFPGVRLDDRAGAEFRLVDAPRDASAVAPQRLDGPVTGSLDESSARANAALDVAVRLELARGPRAAVEIYAPGHAAGGRLVELAVATPLARVGRDDPFARLARTLQRFGFEVARTAPGDTFLTTRILSAFVGPLARFVAGGGDRAVVAATLRDAGFVRDPADALSGIEASRLTHLLPRDPHEADHDLGAALAVLAEPAATARAAADAAPLEPLLLDALSISLLEAALAARATRAVPDPSAIDLVARELIDFPRHLVSLCTWLKRARVAAAVAAPGAHRLVTGAALATAVAFAAEGRELYR